MDTTPRRGTLENPIADCGDHTADPLSDYWYRLEKSDQPGTLDGDPR